MHKTGIRQEIIDRVVARRNRYHIFDKLDPAKTAIVIIDMQGMFCAPGAPGEVPESRNIVNEINALNRELRKLGVKIIWCTHANSQVDGKSDWGMFIDNFVAGENRARTIQALTPDAQGQQIWPDLEVEANDVKIFKNRYSAMIGGSSQLERILRSLGIENILIAGTKTNICCEATARDAMMLDFKVVMLSDCTAALSEEEHRAALENMIQQFGDVYTSQEVLDVIKASRN
jgi:ureidoacrylate peracid hydrolase